METVVHHDLLRFTGGAVEKVEAVWTGDWPPPKTMAVAVGKHSKIVKVFDPMDQPRHLLFQLARCETIEFCVYRRISYSLLPPSEQTMRGAKYVPANRSLNAIGPFA